MTDQNLISEQTPNSVDQLVGEGKKFRTTDDLAKGKLEADAFIEQLKAEMAELKADLNSRAQLEDILERIENRPAGNNTEHNQTPSNTPSPDIDKLLDQKIAKREAERTASENLRVTMEAVEKHYGADYQEKIKAKAASLKLDIAEVNALAKKSPTALLELLGIGTKNAAGFTPTPLNSRPTEKAGFTPSDGRRNYKYYQDLRKADKSRYQSAEVQLQMHKDAIAAAERGEDFYS